MTTVRLSTRFALKRLGESGRVKLGLPVEPT